jgi:phospholipase C
MGFDRRSFLQLLGMGALANSLPESIAKALAIPANNSTGTIADVEHVVVLMQENRSFDHYFGSLRGVRGFGDPRAASLPDGHSVFQQPDGAGSHILPFHPEGADLGLKFIKDLQHDWATTHYAWNEGRYDQWVPAKTALTMAYLQRSDIPYHYALADAFTVCDAYHCSLLGPTDPNRYHMFSGWVGNDGKGGGPVIDNSEAGYTWSTFPEVLEAAGISWKVYQDIGLGLDAAGHWGDTQNPYIGTYGDNSLLYFEQYREAKPGSPLFDKARTGTQVTAGGTLFDHFRQDVADNALPQVSWLVAPEAYTEHPNWPANFGAYYISQILDALTANQAVWSKTVFFIVYDENDGFFDHAVPPTPPQNLGQGRSSISVENEFYPGSSDNPGGPYGLGARVPMLVVSPWSKGGWVASEVFDHTSLIRFIQKRFATAQEPLHAPNISAWRGAVCGDLTSAFNFTTPNAAAVSLPSTALYAPVDTERHPDFAPQPPTAQRMPTQEPGTRPARASPYVLHVAAAPNLGTGSILLQFANRGTRACVFQVRSAHAVEAPRTYTVGPNRQLDDSWNSRKLGLDSYGLFVYGPNGFYRAYQGSHLSLAVAIDSSIAYDIAKGGVILTATNSGLIDCELNIADGYGGDIMTRPLPRGMTFEHFFGLDKSFGWYDFLLTAAQDSTFRQQLAGHLETGKDGVTDPAMPVKRIP